ncbi:MAG: DUF4105 domain-containing protein [Bdellovibrio sp.]|nr:DUF4105 domain-containing protein [Bdellovibrio sp.]
MLTAAALFFQLLIPSPALALNLKLEGSHTAQEKAVASNIIESTQAALPLSLKNRLNFDLTIKFVSSTDSADRINLGKASLLRDTIFLNSKFLTGQGASFSKEAAQKTLAHEIAHFYDGKNFESADLRALRKVCLATKNSGVDPVCASLKGKGLSVSEDPEFMALTGWESSGFTGKNNNNFTRRLPDPYAVSEIRESFPVYFESYTFDPQFACKLPALNKYFNKVFFENKTANCNSEMTWYLAGSENAFAKIDRNRIWAIDVLYASEGSDTASLFGHSMLRMVICKEGRTPGPDCYKDFSDHIVLSFAALSSTGNFGNIAGMTGKYPLNLFATPFLKIKTQYNLMELRDLYALPLKLNNTQKDLLIDQLYTLHWNFEGRYLFAARNCTTEIVRALTAIGIPLTTIARLDGSSPDKLLRSLFQSPLSYEQHKSKADLQTNKILFFVSSQKNVTDALTLVSKALDDSHLNTIEKYIENVDANQFNRLLSIAKTRPPLLYATYYMEMIRKARIEAQLVSKVIQNDESRSTALKEFQAKSSRLNFSYRFIGSFLSNKSYGVASSEEIESAVASYTTQFEIDKRALAAQMKAAQLAQTVQDSQLAAATDRLNKVAATIKESKF